jgi:hypothetical protein
MLSESPRAAVVDGTLATWSVWIVIHGGGAIISALTIVALVLRVMLLWRQWKAGR